MSVEINAAGLIRLTGRCPIEDAEELQSLLLNHPGASVDWSDCRGAHTAVIQILLAAKAPVLGSPHDSFLQQHIAPHLSSAISPPEDDG